MKIHQIQIEDNRAKDIMESASNPNHSQVDCNNFAGEMAKQVKNVSVGDTCVFHNHLFPDGQFTLEAKTVFKPHFEYPDGTMMSTRYRIKGTQI